MTGSALTATASAGRTHSPPRTKLPAPPEFTGNAIPHSGASPEHATHLYDQQPHAGPTRRLHPSTAYGSTNEQPRPPSGTAFYYRGNVGRAATASLPPPVKPSG
ncbi:unnamed protein product [Dicrocoelium dendriticum]|nr:unnamed protein product [Dicrocoelium dendriticum]